MGGPVGISGDQLHGVIERAENVVQDLRVEGKREKYSEGKRRQIHYQGGSRTSLIAQPELETAGDGQRISLRRGLTRQRPSATLREGHDFHCARMPSGTHDPPSRFAEVNFVCPHCGSFYEVLRARPNSVSCQATCSTCKGPLPTHDGQFRLEYFQWRKASIGWHRTRSTQDTRS
jgi:hypothetical protein